MEATFKTYRFGIYWVFKCDCENEIVWGGWDCKWFWDIGSKYTRWAVRTCKCQTAYKLDVQTNEVDETTV